MHSLFRGLWRRQLVSRTLAQMSVALASRLSCVHARGVSPYASWYPRAKATRAPIEASMMFLVYVAVALRATRDTRRVGAPMWCQRRLKGASNCARAGLSAALVLSAHARLEEGESILHEEDRDGIEQYPADVVGQHLAGLHLREPRLERGHGGRCLPHS